MTALALDIATPKAFEPLLYPSRYKGAHGGRGSGKSHFFAELMIEDCLRHTGLRAVCIREVQKDLRDSAKKLLETKIQTMGVGARFDVQRAEIITPGGGVIIFQGMQDHTAESIKSLEGFDRAWVEEAQTLSERSLELLRPTIRAPRSEIWASWNPRRKTDAVDAFMRGRARDNAIVVQANWRDNPWFPAELERERLDDQQDNPDRYDHIWEGDYATAFKGAYFAAPLAECRRDGRITRLAADPVLPTRAYVDIGGAGGNADAMAIWIVQFVGREIRVLDYIEGIGQVLAFYTTAMRQRGHRDAQVFLPHDGNNTNNVTGSRYVDHWRDAGFDVSVIQNQGKGAAMQRVEAVRRRFPMIWFNEATTEAGRDALGFYHERKDEQRGVGLGPDHDWSSHAADAFGLMAVAYEEPSERMDYLEIPAFGAV